MNETFSTHYTPQQSSAFVDDDSRWEAVKSRNVKADGLFVYAVRSTGVYSRPTCKARLAHRFNTAFFKTSIEAQSAGYRPCKRCHPENSAPMPEDVGVAKIRAFMKTRPLAAMMEKDGTIAMLSLSQMARQAGLSKWHFHREFKKCFGVTPVEYLRVEKKAARLAISEKKQDESLLPRGGSHIKKGRPCFLSFFETKNHSWRLEIVYWWRT